MVADDAVQSDTDAQPQKRRRRRRRSRRTSGPDNGVENVPTQRIPTDGQDRRRGRWRNRTDGQPAVTMAPTGKVPRPRLPLHITRGVAAGPSVRRRRMTRAEMDELADYLERLPDHLVKRLYSGMGGQPDRIPNKERMIQLAVRAIAQGNRLATLVKSLHHRDRQALAILVQCGGIAHHTELYRELVLSLGGNEREWTRVMSTLGDKGLVAASEEREGHYFYLVPEPLIPHLVEHLHDDVALPSFSHPDVRVIEERHFQPPLDFSIVTLATYIDQHPPRLTQRQEIFKVHKDEMDQFFAQVWPSDSELFSFHIEFLMMHGMVELKGDRLIVNRSVLEEWLQLDPEDQRDLIFASLDKRFPNAEWVLWAIWDVTHPPEDDEVESIWVPERPLQTLYRRWRRGQDWRERFHSGTWATPKAAQQREGYSFTPLVNTGMLELGQWGQEKFYRLTPRATRLLEPPEDEGFTKFYLTPNFEVMAPAGMAPLLFHRIGEIAELVSCDRANTYKISEISIERALERGWRPDDVLEFLRENSQIGLPENVEQTLRGWLGHYGDVEYHDVLLLTVHRSQICRLETHRAIKPFLVHRFVPGMYAVDRSRLDELNEALAEAGFTPHPQVRRYPDDPQAIDARQRLLVQVMEARESRADTTGSEHAADTQPENLHPIPGSGTSSRRSTRRRDDLPPRRSPREVRDICERAIALGQNLRMLYVGRDQTRKLVRVAPERLAVNAKGQTVLVARDLARNERLSYQIVQIERLDTLEQKR